MNVPLPTQQEMQFPATQDLDYYFATRLISQVQRELQKTNRRHLMITSRWLIAFEYLKNLEERILLQETPFEREKAFFESTVAIMLGLGRMLLQQLRAADNISLDSLGVKYEDIAACVSELEDIERSAHKDWSPTEIQKLDGALGDKPS